MPFRDSPVSSRKLSAWLLCSDVVWQPEPGRSPRHPLRLPLTPPRNFRPWGLVIPTPAPTSPPQRRLTLARRPGPSPAPPRWHLLCAPPTLEGTSRTTAPTRYPECPEPRQEQAATRRGPATRANAFSPPPPPPSHVVRAEAGGAAGQLWVLGSLGRWPALSEPGFSSCRKRGEAARRPHGAVGRAEGPHTRGGRSPVPAGPAGRGVGEGRTRRPSSGPWGKRLHSRFLGDPRRPRAESFGGSAESSPAPPRRRGQDRDEAHEVCALGAERDKNTGPEIREDSWQAARWPPLPGGPLPGHRGRETVSG